MAIKVWIARMVCAAAALATTSCDAFAPEWSGWVYPNGHNLSQSIALGKFDDVDACRRTARALVNALSKHDDNGTPLAGDYECGRKCKADNSIGGLNVCAETTK